jgi:hypothetical protein
MWKGERERDCIVCDMLLYALFPFRNAEMYYRF